jgi:dethiobiotin synthetase
VTDFLVTGTDTGVGKTVVSAGLLLALRRRGIRAVGFKPAETGLGAESDSEILAKASGVAEERARPLLRLEEPLAPAVAAERAGTVFDRDAAIARVGELRRAGYTLVIEGAGGILVPFSWDFTALDLAERTGLAAVIVARAGLGTLNHTLLTAYALAGRGVEVRGIVLNRVPEGPDLAEATNPASLRRLLPGVRVVTLPEEGAHGGFEVAERVSARLEPLLGP